MRKNEWDSWRSLVWGHNIKRNAMVRIRYSATVKGAQERVGRILGATQESIIIRVFGEALSIHYKRLVSVELLTKGLLM